MDDNTLSTMAKEKKATRKEMSETAAKLKLHLAAAEGTLQKLVPSDLMCHP